MSQNKIIFLNKGMMEDHIGDPAFKGALRKDQIL